jgi:hypothetical protein
MAPTKHPTDSGVQAELAEAIARSLEGFALRAHSFAGHGALL